METGILLALVGLLGSASLALLFDARQRRMDRRMAAIIPVSSQVSSPTFVRVQHRSSTSIHTLLFKLFKYDPKAVYLWPLSYTVLGSLVFALIVAYGGYFADLSGSYIVGMAIGTTWLGVRGLLGWQRHRYVNKLFQQLPDVVELVTSTVRAGLPVAEAFQVVAREMPEPSATQFGRVCDDMASGKPPEEAVDGIYLRTNIAEYGMFAVTLGVQMKSGGRLTETLQTLADTVRQRVALAAKAKALAGEVIFSSKALVCAPFIVGGLLFFLSPELVNLLYLDPRGRFLLMCALISTTIGGLVIRWMVKRETTI